MNNNNILISEKNQIKSPPDLVTIAIDSIINDIESINDKNIYMLKNNIPHTLFELIERKTLKTLKSTNSIDINLERAKKLLPVQLFEKHVKIYLNMIIEKKFVNINIANIRDNVPKNIYKLFLKIYLKDQNCWKYFIESVLKIHEDDILEILSNISSLNLDQYLGLMNIPVSVAEDFAYDTYVIVLQMWRTNNDTFYHYCRDCIKKYKQIVRETEVFTATGEEIIRDVLLNHHYWCCKCSYTPLFVILDDNDTYFDIECDDN